ncbi:hypothetical protein AX14_004106 [Amanita brunnescens Koide BX004]|nr:hypothetical protein AX14_004106 [Amanita brunnescens Koide BX004]
MVEIPTEIISLSDQYELSADELVFFKAQTKIQDDEELKNHIVAVRDKAFKIYPYPCIKRLGLRLIRQSAEYRRILQLAKERKDAILLDVGCCFGNDLRKAVADGWPVENVIGFDLRKEFWNFGHDLFLDTPETFPAGFVAGDIFDPSMIVPRSPFYMPDLPLLTAHAPPELRSLTSLTPLQGRASAIFLFNGMRNLESAPSSKAFCHSPESWKELWDGIVFEKGTVSVETGVKLLDRGPGRGIQDKTVWMSWGVTRL